MQHPPTAISDGFATSTYIQYLPTYIVFLHTTSLPTTAHSLLLPLSSCNFYHLHSLVFVYLPLHLRPLNSVSHSCLCIISLPQLLPPASTHSLPLIVLHPQFSFLQGVLPHLVLSLPFAYRGWFAILDLNYILGSVSKNGVGGFIFWKQLIT